VLQFSLPAGRWFGVHLRVHASLLLLLALAAGYSAATEASLLRGAALWGALMLALAAREIARGITAAYLGLQVRVLILLPIGGVMALAPRHGGPPAKNSRAVSAVGSAANFLVAAMLLGFAYGIDPHVGLFHQPWITPAHILRSTIWLQVMVGAVNLLPPAAMPSGRLLRVPGAGKPAPVRTTSQTVRFAMSSALALLLILGGVMYGLLWPVLFGMTVLFTAYVGRAAGAASAEGLSVSVRDVMLTEFRPLSASSTLRDALQQTTHTLQELFPVLRGERLVGWISRAALAAKLRAEGDSFLQGAMSRSFQTVSPTEKIGDALRRASALGAGEFVAVVEDGAMVGLLTPVSLERAVGQLRLTRVPAERDAS
jgi:CBS domain-containing protein